jgi:hypothetical protein
MAGMSIGPSKVSFPSTRSAHASSVLQGGEDYDSIMREYERLRQTNPILANYNYYQSPELQQSINQLSENTRTGGYSADAISDIRARGISPIRSVYANAMRNASRSRNLAGGYSPNAGAVDAKFAREQSSVLSDATTDVNARIAEMVAGGKSTALNNLASLSSRETDYRSGIDQDNINEQRRIQTQLPLELLRGRTSLYGTTPAMAELFGQQALQQRGQDMTIPIVKKRRTGGMGYGG